MLYGFTRHPVAVLAIPSPTTAPRCQNAPLSCVPPAAEYPFAGPAQRRLVQLPAKRHGMAESSLMGIFGTHGAVVRKCKNPAFNAVCREPSFRIATSTNTIYLLITNNKSWYFSYTERRCRTLFSRKTPLKAGFQTSFGCCHRVCQKSPVRPCGSTSRSHLDAVGHCRCDGQPATRDGYDDSKPIPGHDTRQDIGPNAPGTAGTAPCRGKGGRGAGYAHRTPSAGLPSAATSPPSAGNPVTRAAPPRQPGFSQITVEEHRS